MSMNEGSIDDMAHFIRTLKHILDTGTPEQKAKVVRWMATYITGGK